MENDRDKVIVEKVLTGDTDAYREIVDRHGARVFSLVCGIVRNRQDAEEVASDVFLKAFSQLQKFRGESTFSTWLYRITYNTAISHVRRRKESMSEIDERRMEAISDEDEEYLLREAQLEQLENGIAMLPAPERALIELFYKQDMSIDDISAVTDDTPGNVKVKLFRTRKKLAAIMEKRL